MKRRTFISAAAAAAMTPVFTGCGASLPNSRDIVSTPEAREHYMRSMLDELCAKGPRPIGSNTHMAAVEVIEREMARALPIVERDTFTFENWEVTGDVYFDIGGSRITVATANKAQGTPTGGLTGILRLIEHKRITYGLFTGSSDEPAAYVALRRHPDPRSSIVEGFGQSAGCIPLAIVGSDDAPRFEEAARTGQTVTYVAPVVHRTDATSANVIGTLPGETEDEVIFVAHLDTVYTSPGANDNTASLLAIMMFAHAISGARPRHTLRFIASTGHEPGYYGMHHIKDIRTSDGSIERIKYAFNFDSVSWGENITIKTTDRSIRDAFTAIDTDLDIPGTPNGIDDSGASLDLNPFRDTNVMCTYVGSTGNDLIGKVHHGMADTPDTVPLECMEITFLLFHEYLKRTEGIV
jgi:hypothetical protein